MEKDTIIARTPPPPKVPQHEVKRLIRKVSKDHEGLFRRLAK
jgi:hypothetical protein